MTHADSNKDSLNERTKRNTIQLAIWTFTWVLSVAFLAFGPKFIWDFNVNISILAIVLNLGLGFKMIMVNKTHLLGLDEMQQRIQLNAMGISLGIGLIVGCAYEILEDIKLISFEPEISHLIIVMSLAYIVAIVLGNRKYA